MDFKNINYAYEQIIPGISLSFSQGKSKYWNLKSVMLYEDQSEQDLRYIFFKPRSLIA